MAIQVSKPQTRDQEPDLSSKSFWTIHQVISSCLILTSCFDSSFLSPQDFCLSFNHVRLWNIPVASIPLSGDIFQCGTKELGPLPLSCCVILVTLLHLGGSLHRIELWHPPVKEENFAWGHPKSLYWFQWVQGWVPRAEYCSWQGSRSAQKTPWDNEADIYFWWFRHCKKKSFVKSWWYLNCVWNLKVLCGPSISTEVKKVDGECTDL